MIRIQLLQGPQAGVTRAYADAALTFGRSPDNTLAIDNEHLSRVHGEIRIENGHYILINHSQNDTTLNGKALKGKPRVLRDGDVVGVGKMKLFVVSPHEGAAAAAVAPIDHPQIPAAPNSGRQPMSKRAKLGIALGVYMLIIVVAAVILGSLSGGGSGGVQLAPQLTDAQIEEEIARPLTVPPSAREAAFHLQEAQALYDRIDTGPDTLYKCHRFYKLSLAYGQQQRFAGLTQVRFDEVQRRLITRITDEYRQAYAMLRNKQWQAAEEAFRRLTLAYPESESPLVENWQQQITVARSHQRKRGLN